MSKAAKEKKPISIIERRLKSGTIFGTSSKPIPLVEPERWTVRVANALISDSHLYDLQAEKGWVYAAPEDLAVRPEEMGFRIMDGRVVRGTHGTEILMKMERADYKAVQALKDRTNIQQTFGKKATKQAIVNAASAEPGGDQGADFLNRTINTVDVKDAREWVAIDE